MRNLIAFIWKHNVFFLFVILEAVCLTLVFRNNFYHKASFINSTNAFTGNIYTMVSNVTQYFHLKETNEHLAQENARLHSFSTKSFADYKIRKGFIIDSLLKQQYVYISARVVNNSVNNQSNFITLDRGRKQGIKPGSGVICPQGIVGIVKDVSDNFASVISLLNKDARISVRIRNTNFFGSLIWEGGDYSEATLLDIPVNVRMQVGDTIETTPFSGKFPEGILAGVVKSFETKPGQSFYYIRIQLSTNFKNLTHVYVIDNLLKGEQLRLEKQTQTEEEPGSQKPQKAK